VQALSITRTDIDMDASLAGRTHASREHDIGAPAGSPMSELALIASRSGLAHDAI